MRFLLLLLLVIISGFKSPVINPTLTKWVIMNGCSLKVDGSTNINNFSCEIINYGKPDTIYINRGNNQPVQLNGSVKLDVKNFDCHNSIMTADLRKTLKAKELPYLTIRFISLSKYPDAASKQEITKGIAVIELAGVSKQFQVDYKVVAAENTYINLVGSRKINFSDFGLTPPRKLGGMIKTNNELSVVFDLRMKVIE
jgi:hypothetical protein